MIFPNVPVIKYEGPESKNPLSFKYYDADKVILGKPMKEHLPFAMAWWHNLCAAGTDMFGRDTMDKSFGASEKGTMEHAKAKVDAGFEFMQKLGENHVYFLPYLMGERSPINDTNARGTFIGMTMDTTRTDLTQAVLEGVAFAIRDMVEVARDLGVVIDSSKVCGGGAKSSLWKKMIANILNAELQCLESEQGPGMGGAMLAMVACGEYGSVQEACDKLVNIASTVKPEPELVAKYEARYQQFKKIYPAVKALFPEIQ